MLFDDEDEDDDGGVLDEEEEDGDDDDICLNETTEFDCGVKTVAGVLISLRLEEDDEDEGFKEGEEGDDDSLFIKGLILVSEITAALIVDYDDDGDDDE